MADGHIEILIGARADRSLEAVFGSAEKRAGRARANIDKALNGGGANAFQGYESAANKAANASVSAQTRAVLQVARMREREERRAEAQRIGAERRVLTEQTKAANAQIANEKRVAAEQARAANAQVASQKRLAAEQAKAANAQIANQKRVAAATEAAERRARADRQQAIDRQVRSQISLDRQRRQEHARNARDSRSVEDSFAYRTAYHGVMRYAPGALHRGTRVANDILRGAGVDLNVGSAVGRVVSLDSQAVTLANQERIATGRTRGAKFYANLARQTATETSSDSDSAMKLQARFAARTGSYETLPTMVPQLARLARASGADPDQVGSAAGAVFQQFRGDPDAAAKTIEVMRAVIGQSAEGAVDMPDYAKQLGRVAAGAFKFEGDRGANVAKLSALTQIAMERGATSAADAARSTGSFVSTLGKGARLKQFEAAGVPIYVDDTVGRDGKVIPGKQRNVMRDPFEIIKDSFRQTGGNIPRLGSMFMDVLGRKAVESLGAIHAGAGGGEAGISAVQKEFDRYMRATMSKDVEAQNMTDIGNSSEAKAKRFQENLDQVVAGMADTVLPALNKMAPDALRVAKLLGDAAGWAAENPGRAITMAIVGSIARAGLESGVRLALERSLARGASVLRGTDGIGGGGPAGSGGPLILGGGGGPKGGGSRLSRFAGGAGKGIAALGLGYTGYQLGQTVGDVAGDSLGGGMLSDVMMGVGGGAAFGLPGVAAGAILGSGKAIYRGTQEMGGGGALWAGISNMLMHPMTPVKDTFFKGMDERENAKARAAADQRGGRQVQAVAAAPTTVKAEFDPAVMSQAVSSGLRNGGELAVRVTNLPPPGNGSALDPPEHGDAGRGRRL